eukprot:symbB.v1.2.015193.t1/scaffold1129.1/size136302/1
MAETIKVAVRVRPLIQREIDAGATIAVAIQHNAVSVNHAGQRRTFGCRDRDELFIVLSKTRSVCAGLIMPIGVWMQKILALLARTKSTTI